MFGCAKAEFRFFDNIHRNRLEGSLVGETKPQPRKPPGSDHVFARDIAGNSLPRSAQLEGEVSERVHGPVFGGAWVAPEVEHCEHIALTCRGILQPVAARLRGSFSHRLPIELAILETDERDARRAEIKRVTKQVNVIEHGGEGICDDLELFLCELMHWKPLAEDTARAQRSSHAEEVLTAV